MAHESARQARDRGATRSKAEKARPPTVPVPQVDIIPGRLTEAEWMALTMVEEGEDVVGDILAELLGRVMDSAFKVYLTQQCIPFTISQAREAMLQIIEWRFLARDEGESAVAEDPTWGEDEEPLACITDAWAQGSVPLLPAPALVELDVPFQSTDHGSVVGQISPGRSLMDGGFEEQMESPKPRDTLSPPPNPELFQEAGPGETLEELEDQKGGRPSSAASRNTSLQQPPAPVKKKVVETVPAGGPHSSPEKSQAASSQESEENPRPLSSQFSIEDLDYPSSIGDLSELVFKKSEVPRTALDPVIARPSQSFQQPWCWSSPLRTLPLPRARRKPSVLPSQWVCPEIEVVDPDSEVQPLQVYRRPRVKKMEPLARPQAAGSSVQVSRAAFCPLPPSGPFPSSRPGYQLPPLGVGPSPSGSQSKVLIPGPESRFLERHLKFSQAARRPSPCTWPGAKWPRGWEGEAEVLRELWAARTRLPPRGRWDQEGQEPHRFSYLEPQILKATSQVMWQPVLLPEALKLAPGVSMWNPQTQVLLRSEAPQQEDKRGCTSPANELRPIQTEAQMARAQTLTSKVWSLPSSKVLPHSKP